MELADSDEHTSLQRLKSFPFYICRQGWSLPEFNSLLDCTIKVGYKPCTQTLDLDELTDTAIHTILLYFKHFWVPPSLIFGKQGLSLPVCSFSFLRDSTLG